jgi:hypothetical protein
MNQKRLGGQPSESARGPPTKRPLWTNRQHNGVSQLVLAKQRQHHVMQRCACCPGASYLSCDVQGELPAHVELTKGTVSQLLPCRATAAQPLKIGHRTGTMCSENKAPNVRSPFEKPAPVFSQVLSLRATPNPNKWRRSLVNRPCCRSCRRTSRSSGAHSIEAPRKRTLAQEPRRHVCEPSTHLGSPGKRRHDEWSRLCERAPSCRRTRVDNRPSCEKLDPQRRCVHNGFGPGGQGPEITIARSAETKPTRMADHRYGSKRSPDPPT